MTNKRKELKITSLDWKFWRKEKKYIKPQKEVLQRLLE